MSRRQRQGWHEPSENHIRIGATCAEVFAVLADGWHYTNWVVGTSHARAVTPDWPSPGAKLFHAAGAWPAMTRDHTEVQSMTPDRRPVLIAHGRPFGSAEVVIELRDDDGGCIVTMRERPVDGPGAWLYGPVPRAVLHRRNDESLARLRALCERPAEPA